MLWGWVTLWCTFALTSVDLSTPRSRRNVRGQVWLQTSLWPIWLKSTSARNIHEYISDIKAQFLPALDICRIVLCLGSPGSWPASRGVAILELGFWSSSPAVSPGGSGQVGRQLGLPPWREHLGRDSSRERGWSQSLLFHSAARTERRLLCFHNLTPPVREGESNEWLKLKAHHILKHAQNEDSLRLQFTSEKSAREVNIVERPHRHTPPISWS